MEIVVEGRTRKTGAMALQIMNRMAAQDKLLRARNLAMSEDLSEEDEEREQRELLEKQDQENEEDEEDIEGFDEPDVAAVVAPVAIASSARVPARSSCSKKQSDV